MNFIIDILTYEKCQVLSRLKRLVSTVDVQDGGVYHQDHSYSQILITTTKTEEELDNWLYENHFDYVGVVKNES